jgi:hypothetical protein
MEHAERLRDYPCQDYLSSTFATSGLWEESGQLWLIEPADRMLEDAEAEFLQVGRPGVDNIGFGYRKGRPGFWALHRIIEPEFQYLAPTIQDFVEGWFAGRIAV